jgi:glycosyltransferase involved in cell wall biosynthesis
MICLNGKKPRVSVITCVYNGAECVRAAVDSILAQTFPDFELLVIDDGSTDETLAIVRDLPATDPRIRVVTQTHQGIPRTLNNAIALTRGEYIALQDDDDVSFPERLAKQVEFLDTHPHAAAVACFAEMTKWNSDDVKIARWPRDPAALRKHILGEGWLVYQDALMRRSAIEFVGGYRVEFPICEDVDLFLRLMDHFQVETIPDVLYRYRRSRRGVTFGIIDSLVMHYLAIARSMARQRMEEGRDLLMR